MMASGYCNLHKELWFFRFLLVAWELIATKTGGINQGIIKLPNSKLEDATIEEMSQNHPIYTRSSMTAPIKNVGMRILSLI
jgi:hypothetical protein